MYQYDPIAKAELDFRLKGNAQATGGLTEPETSTQFQVLGLFPSLENTQQLTK